MRLSVCGAAPFLPPGNWGGKGRGVPWVSDIEINRFFLFRFRTRVLLAACLDTQWLFVTCVSLVLSPMCQDVLPCFCLPAGLRRAATTNDISNQVFHLRYRYDLRQPCAVACVRKTKTKNFFFSFFLFERIVPSARRVWY